MKPDHCETTDNTLLRAPGSQWTNALLADTDGDGLLDGEEDPGDCDDMTTEPLAMTNPRNPDTDGDGIWDGVEVLLLFTDPLDPNDPADATDSSGDGLPDYFVLGLGQDPNNPDWDGNGFSNAYEMIMGSDPLDPASRPTLGDVNGDGRTDNLDAVYMFNFTLGNLTVLPESGDADVTGDGRIDNLDAILLFNYALGNIRILR